MDTATERRLLEKVSVGDACWDWLASRDSKGYGQFALAHGTLRRAHRMIYELLEGPIPAGLEIDHECRNTRCVKPGPGHCVPVTHAENIRRGIGTAPQFQAAKTHCPNNHPYDITDGRARRCSICRKAVVRRADQRYKARQRAS